MTIRSALRYDRRMPTPFQIDPPLEAIIKAEVASGRFADANDVVRTALSLLKREQLLDERLEQSLAQAKAGETIDMDVVFDDLDRELQELVVLRA